MRGLSSILFTSLLFMGCRYSPKEITVRNLLSTDRENETISIPVKDLAPTIQSHKNVVVIEASTGKVLPSQWLDSNDDNQFDELLFQVSMKAKEEKTITIANDEIFSIDADVKTYSRFVPERTDDYAWENDRVAFRTYGPEAQRLVQEGKTGGTLSSGIDCWLKRVSTPVIDKWYKQNAEGLSYHTDHGEGLDNYHVGASRGCGGIGVWLDDSLYVSKNFVSYKTIANGPVRTIFELTYAPWRVKDIEIQEKKRISIDLGSQLSCFEVSLKSNTSLPNCTVGITLHDKRGEVYTDSAQGWFSYWEPLQDSELGTAVIADIKYRPEALDYRTPKKDLSQLYVITKPVNEKIMYYAGFGWKKAGRFNSASDWTNYLNDFVQRLKSPLEVSIK